MQVNILLFPCGFLLHENIVLHTARTHCSSMSNDATFLNLIGYVIDFLLGTARLAESLPAGSRTMERCSKVKSNRCDHERVTLSHTSSTMYRTSHCSCVDTEGSPVATVSDQPRANGAEFKQREQGKHDKIQHLTTVLILRSSLQQS